MSWNKQKVTSAPSGRRRNFGSGGKKRQGGGRGKTTTLGGDVSRFIRKAVVREEESVVFRPERRFADLEIHPSLKKNIIDRGYADPTPIQDGVIPAILEGRDVVGVANTGTGKTAAFLIPLIDRVVRDRKGTSILILTPTRELAIQIDQEFRVFANGSGLRSATVIGGASMSAQVRDLRAGASFIIGTPGRVKDLIERRLMDVSSRNVVVLDEVDRMLDMGFVTDIRRIIGLVREDRQSLFFSATMDHKVREIADSFLTNPVVVTVRSRETSENVHQDVVHIRSKEEKVDRLHDLLIREEFRKVLVFSRTKRGAERLSQTLVQRGLSSDAIHGNLSQRQRERALGNFRQDTIRVLIATDVAARGLDIDGITHVINYDLPMTYEDYIHRIGRTGRGNRVGYALTFIDHFEGESTGSFRSRGRR